MFFNFIKFTSALFLVGPETSSFLATRGALYPFDGEYPYHGAYPYGLGHYPFFSHLEAGEGRFTNERALLRGEGLRESRFLPRSLLTRWE